MGGSKPAAGHVFVVKADVTTMTCDAWLCPTDQRVLHHGRFCTRAGTRRPKETFPDTIGNAARQSPSVIQSSPVPRL